MAHLLACVPASPVQNVLLQQGKEAFHGRYCWLPPTGSIDTAISYKFDQLKCLPLATARCAKCLGQKQQRHTRAFIA